MRSLLAGKRLYGVIILCILIITLIVTFAVMSHHYRGIIEGAISHNRATARYLSVLMSEYELATIGILQSYASRPLLMEALRKKDPRSAFSHLKNLVENYNEIGNAFIADRHGMILTSCLMPDETPAESGSMRELFKEVVRHKRPYISDAYERLSGGQPVAVAIAVPVFDERHNVIGVLATAQKAGFIGDVVGLAGFQPDQRVTIADRKGDIIYSSFYFHGREVTQYTPSNLLKRISGMIGKDMEIDDPQGKGATVFVSVAPVKKTGWVVIVEQDKASVIKPFYRHFVRTATTGFTLFLLFSVGVLFFRREYKYRKTKDLLEAEERYRTIFENMTEGFFRSTPDGRFILSNPALARTLGYEKPQEIIDEIYSIADQVYADPKGRIDFMKQLEEKGEIKDFITRFKRKDGSLFWVQTNARVVRDRANNILYYEGISHDITARKEAQDQIKASLQEKEVMLKEIHHRVKNNLQVISSLLMLESMHLKDKDPTILLRESQDRIRAMALVHERLYKSTDLAHIDMRTFIDELADGIYRTHMVDAERVVLKKDIEEIVLPVNTAIPCGLALNEIITNAIKHAFPSGRSGEIHIEMTAGADNEIRLIVRDNGTGMPDLDEIKQRETLGLRLIHILIEDQLKGEVTLGMEKGTAFYLCFERGR